MTAPILLLAETGIVIRNLLLGTFADEVTRSVPLVVAVKRPDDPRLCEIVAGKRMSLVNYPTEPDPVPLTRLRKLRDWQTYVYYFKDAEKQTASSELQTRFDDSTHTWFGDAGIKLISLVGRTVKRVGLMGMFEERYLRHLEARPITQAWRDLLSQIRPAAVLATTLSLSTKGHSSGDLPAILAARTLGIRCGTLIQSWDNLSSKSAVLPSWLDRYWTWSATMNRELHELYPRVSNTRVEAVGGPQFDFHSKEIVEPRETYLSKLGLDPARPFVLFGTGTPIRIPTEPTVVIALARALRQRLPRCQMLVRIHPKDGGQRWHALDATLNELGIVVQRTAPDTKMDEGSFVPPREFYREQVSCLVHAAVVVNSSSTLTVDAALLDRPIVCVAYDELPDPRFPEGRALLFSRSTHYAPLVATGGVTLARSRDACVSAIAEYLDDPARSADGRRAIVELVTGAADGKAGQRLARGVLQLANTSS